MDHYPERERLSQPSQDPHIYLSEDGRLYFSPTDPQNSSSSTPQQNLQSSEDLLNPEIYSARKMRDRWAGWVMIGCSLLLFLGFLDLVFMMLDEYNQEISSILVMIRTATDCFMIFTAWIGSRAAKQLNSQSTRTFYKAMVICGVLCVGSFCLIMIESSSRDELNPNDGRRLYEAGRYQSLYDNFESSYNTQLDRIDTDKQQEYPVDCDEDNCQDEEVSASISREWVKAAEKYFTLYEQQIKDLSLDTYVSWDMDEIEDLRDFIRENGQDIEDMYRSYEGKWNYSEDEYSYEETEIDINSEGRKLQAYSSKQWDCKDNDDDQDEGDKGGRKLQGNSNLKWHWSDADEDEYGNKGGRKVKEYWHSDWLFKIKEFTDKDEYKQSDFKVTMSEEHLLSNWKDEDENTYEYKYSNTYLNTDNAGRSLQHYSTSDSSDYDDTDDNEEYIYTETQIDTEDCRGLQHKHDPDIDVKKYDIPLNELHYHFEYDYDEEDEDRHSSEDLDEGQVYENTETFYVILGFFSIALVSFSFSLCCLCATRLYKSSVSYERLMNRPNNHMGINQVHSHYKAIPRNAPNLYPNLAPVGASVPSQ